MHNLKANSRSQQGVTLLELMIVVAIVGILAMFAYPSYQELVKQSRRADAQGALMSFAGAMERHFTVNDSYCGAGSTTVSNCGSSSNDDSGIPTVFSAKSPLDGIEVYYNLTISSVSSTSFILEADPAGIQSDDICGTMTVDHTGARTPSPATSDCWR